MKNTFEIRLLNENDAAAALNIYAHYVQHTIISFEYEVPTLEDFSGRIASTVPDFPWLVCLLDGKMIGYAYAHKHRFRTAYQWSPESSVYLAVDFQSKGVGRVLYETLFEILKLQGHINVFAGVGLPNEKSVAFHKALGFREVGIFKKIGYKHGGWHDTHWFQLDLQEHVLDPPVPKVMKEIQDTDELKEILEKANERVQHI